MARPARGWAFSVVAIPAALVLVRDVAPAEVCQRLVRDDAQSLEWIDAARPDRAQVLPLVAEVEHVRELLAGLQPPQVCATVIEQVLGIVIVIAEDAQSVTVGAREFVQVTAVPAGERVIDCPCELNKGVAARSSEDPSWARPDGLTM